LHDLISTGIQRDVEMDRPCVDVAKYNARIMSRFGEELA
jgi:hypothetical protein